MEHMWLMRRSEKSGPATRLTAAGLVVACSVSVGTALVASADSVSDQKKRNDQKIAALGQQLEGTNASLARAYVNLQRTNAALPIAQQRVVAAQGAQARAVAAQAAAEATEARAIAAHETVFMKVKNFSSSFFWSWTSATPGMPLMELATMSNFPGSDRFTR